MNEDETLKIPETLPEIGKMLNDMFAMLCEIQSYQMQTVMRLGQINSRELYIGERTRSGH